MRRLRPFWVLPFAVSILFSLHCGEDSSSGPDESPLTIVPDSVAIEASSSQQFEVDYSGQTPTVKWYVEGVEGGDPFNGMITGDGLYVAPAEPSIGSGITVTAKAFEDSILDGTAKVLVTRTLETPFITVSPETVTVALSDTIKFSSEVFGCPSGAVIWSVESALGSPFSVGEIGSDGTYLAPEWPDADFTLLVRATSTSCTDKSGIAAVFFRGPPFEFRIELEDFTNSLDAGSAPIQAEHCSAASNGWAVTGMDLSGEWIEVPMQVPVSGTYEAIVVYAADEDNEIMVTVMVQGCGDPAPQAAFALDEGTGMG